MRSASTRVLITLLTAVAPLGCVARTPVRRGTSFPAEPVRAREEPLRVRTGLEVLSGTGFAALRSRRVGVVTNPTGVDRDLGSLVDLVAAAPGVELVAVFGPEHGARGAAQAGVEVGDARDQATGVAVYSLYGRTRKPTSAMLEGVDVLLFDIQDIGVRTYTYLSTLVRVLEAAAENAVEVWVLDRPVPIGADVFEGPVLDPALESFVGIHPLPLRHGLTAGEFAFMVNEERKIGARLKVVKMRNYRRSFGHASTGAPWVAPSPNIPDVETALVYAGMVLIEGVATLSEGRGTTRPFRLVGAPWLDGRALAARMNRSVEGARFREAWFTPTMSKHAGERCSGVEIHVTDPAGYRPITVALALLHHVRDLHPGEFRFRDGAFDRLAGTTEVRRALEAGMPFTTIVDGFRAGLVEYESRRRRYLLYD